MDYRQDKPEDPRKKRLEEEEKRRKRWNSLPMWVLGNSFLRAILIKIKWGEPGQFPVGMIELMDAQEPAVKLIDEATGYLRGLGPDSGLPDEHIEELRGRIAALEYAVNRETRSGIYYCIVDIEEKTKSLSMLLQRARADTKVG
jgi:hypothetical protein